MTAEHSDKWHEDLARASNLIPIQEFKDDALFLRGRLQRNLKTKPHDPTAWHDFLQHLDAERRKAPADDPLQSGKRSALITLYRIATDIIPKTATNRHSPTYLTLWLDFAALQAEQPEEAYLARETFKSLKLLRIGQTLPQFWSAWSNLEKRLGNPDKAARLHAEAEARSQPKNSAKHHSAVKANSNSTPAASQVTPKLPFTSRPPTRPPLRAVTQHQRDEHVPSSPSFSLLPATPVANPPPAQSRIPEPTPPRQVVSHRKPASPERMRRAAPRREFESPVILSPEEQPPRRSVQRVGTVRARSPQNTPSVTALPSVQRPRSHTPAPRGLSPAPAPVDNMGMPGSADRMSPDLVSPQDSPQDLRARGHGTGGRMMTPVPQAMPGFLEGKATVTVNQRQYVVLGVAGKGGSSRVFKVLSSNMEVLALKRVRVNRTAPSFKTTFDSYANEIDLLQRLRGKPSIVTCYDAEVREDLGTIQLIMEYGDTDLARKLLTDKRNTNDSDKRMDRRVYWRQMLEAVRTIHEEKIVHSDLKPANFLCVSGQLKLIDFGIANAIMTDDTTKIIRDSQQGTPNYMSPETLTEYEGDDVDDMDISTDMRPAKFRIGRASDIWSLGCILYQMVYGFTPYAHLRNMMQKLRAIQDPNHRINYPPVDDPHVIDVLHGCLQHDPAQRMSIPTLLQHPYLNRLGGSADGTKVGSGSQEMNAEERKALLYAGMGKMFRMYQSMSLDQLRDEWLNGDRSSFDRVMDDVVRRVEADREPKRLDMMLRTPTSTAVTNSNASATRTREQVMR